jgi:hypothetical protein
MSRSEHVALRLSDEPELSCEVEFCREVAYPHGAQGYSGYVSACPRHAQEAVDRAIAEGAMAPEERRP